MSVESRREKGEKFILLKGLTYDYEIAYFLASKEDLISLREKRHERVYLYPVKINSDIVKKLFLKISNKVNKLYYKPEFYHLFSNNCVNAITKEIEGISENKFSFFEAIFAPGLFDRDLYHMNLIDDNEKDFEKIKNKYLIHFK